MMKKIAAALCFVAGLWASSAAAQSGCQYIAYGAVPTPGQWQFCFQQKLDNSGFVPINPANIVGVAPITITGVGNQYYWGINAATNTTLGAARCDGTTTICVGGVIIATGNLSLAVGDPIAGCAAGFALYANNSAMLACQPFPVRSVANADGSITVSAASNNVTVGINVDHANQWTAPQATAPSTAQWAGLNIGVGVAPNSPNGGAIWNTSSGQFDQIGGVTYQAVLAPILPAGIRAGNGVRLVSGGSSGIIAGVAVRLVSGGSSGIIAGVAIRVLTTSPQTYPCGAGVPVVGAAIGVDCGTAALGTAAYTAAGTGLAISGSNLNSNAVTFIDFPAVLTTTMSGKAGFYKVSKASTVDNIEFSALSFTGTTATITLYECGVSTTCSAPTTIGTATITTSGTVADGTVSSASITAGDYVAWAVAAGTFTAVSVQGTAQLHAN
jgi:hypothetical protein